MPFRIPGREVLPERLTSVLDAICAAYGTGWDVAAGSADTAGQADGGLADEALRRALGRRQVGPDQLHAAIQSRSTPVVAVRCSRARGPPGVGVADGLT